MLLLAIVLVVHPSASPVMPPVVYDHNVRAHRIARNTGSMDLVHRIVNKASPPPRYLTPTASPHAAVAHVSTPRASLPTADVPAWSLASFLKRHMGACLLEHTTAWVRQTWRDLDRGGRRLVQVFVGTQLCGEDASN